MILELKNVSSKMEILLRCHCSVKPHAAGQISLTRRILWKKSQVSAIPSRPQTWPGETGGGRHIYCTFEV